MDPLGRSPPRAVIEPAELVWRDGRPYSPRFNDIYHEAAGAEEAAAEVERVFLAPAGFDDQLDRRDPIFIGELGFGTGLNFAVCAARCLAAGRRLHFISVDAAPIAPEVFRDLCRARRKAQPVYGELAGAYPPLIGGWHQRSLCGGRIRLSLFWGEAASGLADLVAGQHHPVDLWLLDGFAPDRNPEMWTPELMRRIAAVSRTGTRVTTFTAAGRVRRALQKVGFRMSRVDQRPHKRETLAGSFERRGLEPAECPAMVHVVGAGLAGATAARALADWGIDVVVSEAGSSVASGASAVPVTVMHPRLHHDGGDAATLKAIAYAHGVAAVRHLTDQPDSGLRTGGALQVTAPNFPEERLVAVAEAYVPTGLGLELLDSREATDLAGVRVDTSALWFPDAHVVDASRLCRALLAHERIIVQTGVHATRWPDEPTVLACGAAAQRFPGAGFLELATVHGQLDLVRATTPTPFRPLVALIGGGYVVPGIDDGLLAVGATYEHAPWPDERASTHNLGHLNRLVGDRGHELVRHHRAARCITSDRNPAIGNLYDLSGARSAGRVVSTGHGSMGTVTCHLGGAIVHSSLTGALTPLTGPLAELVSPLRFRTRQARRGYRMGASE